MSGRVRAKEGVIMKLLLLRPIPEDKSSLLPCRFRGAVIAIETCDVCGSIGRGQFLPIRACSAPGLKGRCAHSHFETIRRTDICTSCEVREV